MNPFIQTFTVQKNEIDTLNHVNNVTYLKWVQEVSVTHWFEIVTPTIKEHYYWVVLRHEVDYYHPAFLEDELTAVTWVGETDGVKSDRFVHFYCKDKLLARAKTTWCLMDKKSNKPTRITSEIQDILEPFKM